MTIQKAMTEPRRISAGRGLAGRGTRAARRGPLTARLEPTSTKDFVAARFETADHVHNIAVAADAPTNAIALVVDANLKVLHRVSGPVGGGARLSLPGLVFEPGLALMVLVGGREATKGVTYTMSLDLQ